MPRQASRLETDTTVVLQSPGRQALTAGFLSAAGSYMEVIWARGNLRDTVPTSTQEPGGCMVLQSRPQARVYMLKDLGPSSTHFPETDGASLQGQCTVNISAKGKHTPSSAGATLPLQPIGS